MLKPGTELRVDGSLSRHSPTMCFFNNVYFPDGRALSVNGPRGAQPRAPASGAAAAHGHLRHLAARAPARAGPAPRGHEPAAADDGVPDAGRSGRRRGLRSVQGRPDVPLRSGRDPARLGRTRHAAVDHSRAGQGRTAARVDGRGPHGRPPHARASRQRAADVTRSFDRLLRRRHARHRDGELLGRRAEPIRRGTGQADPRAAAFGGPDVGRAVVVRCSSASGWSSRCS